jgi:hypothetical protein
MPGLVRYGPGFGEQVFPFDTRQTAIVPIGAGMFPAVIEKPDVVITILDWLDFSFNEGVKFGEIGCEFGRQIEIHGGTPPEIPP